MSVESTWNRGPSRVRFGDFELEVEREELFREARPVALRAQTAKLLALLVRNAGHIVSREEIQSSVWDSDTHVDFDQGINHCIRQLRSTLHDEAGSPRFIETIPRRGYRFVAPVVPVAGEAAERTRPTRRTARWSFWLAAAALAVVAIAVWQAGVLSVEETSTPVLVVLPFESLDGSEPLFVDSLTEELITQLSKRYSGRMGVIARTSAMQFKNTDLGIDEISRKLGADYLLEGSVRRSGERLRITVQLIRAADASHLWATNFDRAIEDVIDLQEEVSSKIATSLGLKLLPQDSRDAGAATTPAAYQAYLEGRGLFHNRDPRNPGAHIEALERAVALDPGFAPAWALLGEALRLGPEPPSEKMPRARAALEKALALDESLPEAHLSLGQIRFYYDWDLEGTRQSLQRAVELHPGYAEAWHMYAAYFSVTGRHDEALAAVRRAETLDPLSPMVTSDIGWYSYFARRYEDAIEGCRATLEQRPRFYWGHRCIIHASLMLGDREGARRQMREDMRARQATDRELAVLDAENVDEAIDSYWAWDLARQERRAERFYRSPAALGQIHLVRGDLPQALDAFEQAVLDRSGWILPFLRVDPTADPLRDDPRFRALLDTIEQGSVTRASR